jgi:hypothetical protein
MSYIAWPLSTTSRLTAALIASLCLLGCGVTDDPTGAATSAAEAPTAAQSDASQPDSSSSPERLTRHEDGTLGDGFCGALAIFACANSFTSCVGQPDGTSCGGINILGCGHYGCGCTGGTSNNGLFASCTADFAVGK